MNKNDSEVNFDSIKQSLSYESKSGRYYLVEFPDHHYVVPAEVDYFLGLFNKYTKLDFYDGIYGDAFCQLISQILEAIVSNEADIIRKQGFYELHNLRDFCVFLSNLIDDCKRNNADKVTIEGLDQICKNIIRYHDYEFRISSTYPAIMKGCESGFDLNHLNDMTGDDSLSLLFGPLLIELECNENILVEGFTESKYRVFKEFIDELAIVAFTDPQHTWNCFTYKGGHDYGHFKN